MSMVAWYKMNGDATDASGNGEDGTATDMTYVAGKVGQAGSFNGSTSRIVSGNGSSLSFTNEIFTFALWFQTSSATDQYFLYKGVANREYNFGITSLGGVIGRIFDRGFSHLHDDVNSAGTYKDGAWHHGAFVGNGSQLVLYIDGVAETPVNITSAMGDYDQDLQIGRYGGGSVYFNGLIDDVRIYDEALNAQSVELIYADGVGTETAWPKWPIKGMTKAGKSSLLGVVAQ